jgi:hypothetical protein
VVAEDVAAEDVEDEHLKTFLFSSFSWFEAKGMYVQQLEGVGGSPTHPSIVYVKVCFPLKRCGPMC